MSAVFVVDINKAMQLSVLIVILYSSCVGVVSAACVNSACSDPTTDCDTCADQVATGPSAHTVFKNALGTNLFKCGGGGACVLDEVQFNTTAYDVSQCNQLTNTCCRPVYESYALACPHKRCAMSMGCNLLGYCEYAAAIDQYNGCCDIGADCPPTSTLMPTLLQTECQIASCDNSRNCVYTNRTNCCMTDGDCAPFPGQGACVENLCDDDPVLIGRKTCIRRTNSECPCTSNTDCNDGQSCSLNQCNGGTNRCTASSQLFAGCCTNDENAPSQCNQDACHISPTCANEVITRGLDMFLPNYKCQLTDTTPGGCCISSSNCDALSQASVCIAAPSVCSGNMCLLDADGYNTGMEILPCCYESIDCLESDNSAPDDRCRWLSCSGTPLDAVMVSASFKCVSMSISGCSAGSTPSGVQPTLSLGAPQFGNCFYTCGDADQNTITLDHTILNPSVGGGGNKPLYNYTVIITADNAVSAAYIDSITLSGVSLQSGSRVLPIPLFVLKGAAQSLGTQFSQEFALTQALPLFPGDILTVESQIMYSQGAMTYTQITVTLKVVPYDICNAFFVQTPGNANCITTADYGKVLVRPAQTSPANVLTLDGSGCGTVCPPLGPTTAPSPTPPGATPAPTPSAPVGVLANFIVSPASRGCLWDCNDSVDGFRNRIDYDLSFFNPSFTASAAMFDSVKLTFNGNGAGGPFTQSQIQSTAVPATIRTPANTYGALSVDSGGTFSSLIDTTPLGPGETKTYSARFFITGAAPAGLQTVTLTATAYVNRTCDAQLVAASVCSQTQADSAVTILYSASVAPLTLSLDGVECGLPCPPSMLAMAPLTKSHSITMDCDFDCAGDVDLRNRYTLHVTLKNEGALPPSGRAFGIHQVRVTVGESPAEGYPMDVVEGSLVIKVPAEGLTFPMKPATGDTTQADGTYAVTRDFDSPSNPRRFVLPLQPQESGTYDVQYYITGERPITPGFSGFIISVLQLCETACTVLEIEENPAFCAFPTLPVTDTPYDEQLVAGGFFSLIFPYPGTCPVPCLVERNPPGVIGGTAFIDSNSNGIIEDSETRLSNIRITLNLVSDNSVFATTLSGADGKYSFSTFPGTNSFYLKVVNATIPHDYTITLFEPTGSQFFDNRFNAALRSDTISLASSGGNYSAAFFELYNAGFKPIPPCVPVMTPTSDPASGLLLQLDESIATSVSCDACTELLPSNTCSGTGVCDRTLSHNAISLQYTLSNFGPFTSDSGSVSIKLRPLQRHDLVCAEAQLQDSANIHLLRTRAAVLSGAFRRYAEIELAWRMLPVGNDVARFRVRFVYCSDVDMPTFNVTAEIFGDSCVNTINSWRRCAPGIDVRKCYNETLVDVSDLSCIGCPPTPSPSAGGDDDDDDDDDSQSTAVLSSTLMHQFSTECEAALCVNHNVFDALQCTDRPWAILQCQSAAADGRGGQHLIFSLLNPSAQNSEGGSWLITYQRYAPVDENQPCGAIGEDSDHLPLFALFSGTNVTLSRPVVASISEDVKTQSFEMEIEFTTVPAGGNLVLTLFAYECLFAAQSAYYVVGSRLRTNLCYDKTAGGCSETSTHNITALSSSCPPTSGCAPITSQMFVPALGVGAVAAGEGDRSTLVTVIIVGVALVAVGVLCGIGMLSLFRLYQKRRSSSQTSQTEARYRPRSSESKQHAVLTDKLLPGSTRRRYGK